jgi:hypothetical protein
MLRMPKDVRLIKYALDIQSIYRTEINGFVGCPKVTITIRMCDPESNYPDRLKFSIHFRTYMKS